MFSGFFCCNVMLAAGMLMPSFHTFCVAEGSFRRKRNRLRESGSVGQGRVNMGFDVSVPTSFNIGGYVMTSIHLPAVNSKYTTVNFKYFS